MRLIPDKPVVTRVVPGHVAVRDLVQEDAVGQVLLYAVFNVRLTSCELYTPIPFSWLSYAVLL